MSEYYLPDTSGSDPLYQQTNMSVCLFCIGQTISFRASPIFIDTLQIIPVGVGRTPLVLGTDFTYDETADVDYNAMSAAYLAKPDFSKTLVRQVTIRKLPTDQNGKVVPVSAYMNYQEFYRTNPGDYFGNGDPYEVTPDLIQSHTRLIASLKQQFASAGNVVATTTAVPTFLPEDINEEIATNVITDEKHTVNSVEGIVYIRPVNGPFFRDSLVLTVNGMRLVPGTDFQVSSFDKLRTERSTNIGGIYWFIQLLSPVAGDVLVTYHPVGGQITMSDLIAVWNRMVAITDFLNGSAFLTEGSLVDTPVMRQCVSAINEVKADMRKLLTTPNYADATAGTSVQKVFTATDSNLHWYTIAKLYQTAGDTKSIVTADSFHGRIFFPVNNVACEFIADLNLQDAHLPLSFKTLSLVTDPQFVLFGDVSVKTPVYPIFRVVYSSTGQGMGGVYLQVGIALPTLSDTPMIEDLSSVESCWLLDKTQSVISGQGLPTAVAPQDSGFLLPDGKTIWGTVGDGTAQQILAVPDLSSGYLIYAGGGVLLTSFDSASGKVWSVPSVLPAYFPIEYIRELDVIMTQSDGSISKTTIPMTGQTNTTRSGNGYVTLSGGSVASMQAIYKNTSGTVSLSFSLKSPAGAGNTATVSYIIAKA